MNPTRITTGNLLRRVYSSRGMTFGQISEWYCKTKGFDYDEMEQVNRPKFGKITVRVNRGVATAQLQKMVKNKWLTKFGDRYTVSLSGIQKLQKSGY